MNIEKITADISQAGNVIANKLRTFEDIVKSSVSMVNAIADIEHDMDCVLTDIHTRAEMSGKPDNHISRVYKTETKEHKRLLTMAKGLKSTLKNLEYRECK